MPDVRAIEAERVSQQLAVGQRVYDSSGQKLGEVAHVDLATGWMTVERGLFAPKDLYVPFNLVRSIDERELYLLLPKEDLERDYAEPPGKTTVVEGPARGAAGERTSAEITVEPSGYDGRPLTVARTDLDDIKATLEVGMAVYSPDGAELGIIRQYSPSSGWLVVKEGIISQHDLYVPVTLVESVDTVARAAFLVDYARLVYVAVSAGDLGRVRDLHPDGTPLAGLASPAAGQ